MRQPNGIPQRPLRVNKCPLRLHRHRPIHLPLGKRPLRPAKKTLINLRPPLIQPPLARKLLLYMRPNTQFVTQPLTLLRCTRGRSRPLLPDKIPSNSLERIMERSAVRPLLTARSTAVLAKSNIFGFSSVRNCSVLSIYVDEFRIEQ